MSAQMAVCFFFAGPLMSWILVQGVPRLLPEGKPGCVPSFREEKNGSFFFFLF